MTPSVATQRDMGVDGLRELARDIHYALCDDGLAPLSPTDNNAMRDCILRVLTPERIAALSGQGGALITGATDAALRRVVRNAGSSYSQKEVAAALAALSAPVVASPPALEGDEAMARHWIDRYAAGIDDEPQMDRIAEALYPAQPEDEPYCYAGIGPMRHSPNDGKHDVRWLYDSPANAEYYGCHTAFPLYTRPAPAHAVIAQMRRAAELLGDAQVAHDLLEWADELSHPPAASNAAEQEVG